jgi:serine/threonine protein kinase
MNSGVVHESETSRRPSKKRSKQHNDCEIDLPNAISSPRGNLGTNGQNSEQDRKPSKSASEEVANKQSRHGSKEVETCNQDAEQEDGLTQKFTKMEEEKFDCLEHAKVRMKECDPKDEWHVHKMIAEGTSSVVNHITAKTSRNSGGEDTVAVLKVARADKGFELVREARFLQHISSHQHVVQLLGFYHSKKFGTALALELLTGGETLQLVEHPCTELDVMLVTIQVLQALEFVHSRGIVHRDVKAENIVFSGRGTEVKLVDFGLAAFEDDDEAMTKRCGTPGYIAPEVIQATERYSFAVDLFAVGAVVYLLISGHLPFRSQTLINILRKTLKCSVKFEDEVWCGLDRCQSVVKTLLVKDAKRRPTAAALAKHPWFEYLARSPESGPEGNGNPSDKASSSAGEDKHSSSPPYPEESFGA